MTNWIQDIQNHVEKYLEKQKEIESALQKVIDEIHKPVQPFKVKPELISKSPLEWRVRVKLKGLDDVAIKISYTDILNAGGHQDSYGDIIPDFPKDLEIALQGILVSKIKQAISFT